MWALPAGRMPESRGFDLKAVQAGALIAASGVRDDPGREVRFDFARFDAAR